MVSLPRRPGPGFLWRSNSVHNHAGALGIRRSCSTGWTRVGESGRVICCASCVADTGSPDGCLILDLAGSLETAGQRSGFPSSMPRMARSRLRAATLVMADGVLGRQAHRYSFEVAIYDPEGAPAHLVGWNRECIERAIRHIWSVMRSSCDGGRRCAANGKPGSAKRGQTVVCVE